MSEEIIWFISSGMLSPKKRDSQFSRRQRFLNYGALSLCSTLKLNGYEVTLCHGGFTAPRDFIDSIIPDGFMSSLYPIFLSLPSFYSIDWAQKFLNIIREIDPQRKVVVGGRWVVDSHKEWVIQKLKPDYVAQGLYENSIVDLVKNFHESGMGNRGLIANKLDHRLVSGFEEYQPVLEASRGCGLGCSFCEEKNIPLTKMKSPAKFVEEMMELKSLYGNSNISPYAQASFFSPNLGWSKKLSEYWEGNSPFWRCETRVDILKPEAISYLAKGGLKVVDLGLESASPKQLLRMRKTKDPSLYLERAEDLIYELYSNGVWVKLNYLLYAGENFQTLDETRRWLDKFRGVIKGISVGPVVVFGSREYSSMFCNELFSYGASVVDPLSADTKGVTHLNLSKDISYSDAERLALEVSRDFMSEKDYFDLKSFSYYPIGYKFSDFLNDVGQSDISKLPFDISDIYR